MLVTDAIRQRALQRCLDAAAPNGQAVALERLAEHWRQTGLRQEDLALALALALELGSVEMIRAGGGIRLRAVPALRVPDAAVFEHDQTMPVEPPELLDRRLDELARRRSGTAAPRLFTRERQRDRRRA